MFEDYTICPYPGLRSFNEDESIYFKGRDHHTIEVIQLLQKNKFLMVTGASGDGKSSLIFGGLVPNARAGFFKAKYNNWKVAQFRPERDPLTNLSKSLAEALEISDANIAETELQRGYSSLVELYKNSDFYEDEQTTKEADAKHSHANLLIIVDQFEEIFTNPENYVNGTPSHHAQVTINLLLETAKISLKENCPIFVVFTMRSDYIGQCTAFRGLPEHIGFSQFFVPRLKRKALKQVVQEPAILSGCSISNRLVERMLFDLEEGVDQLPVLQHALNQVWLAADNGKVEMDLVHYAKVGGMSAIDLPNGEVDEFTNWFAELPEWKKPLYENPSLNNVLDIHADILYHGASEYYNKRNPGQPISIKEGKYIIAMVFAGLTKIDDSRAVRNRMSLQEITNIINKNQFDISLVGEVINYFRESGNTFVHPFINEEVHESKKLEADSVLDITHESLIRNWGKLNKWVEKEFEYFEIYQDLKKQVDRWVSNDRSKRYLLPIGPLTYFEEWFNESNPNKYWISRYNDSSNDKSENLKEAEHILDNIKQLLKRSKNNLIVTRTVMKHGSARIATFLAILVVIGLSSFYYIDAEKKQNDQVLLIINDKSTELILHQEVNVLNKGFYMIYNERIKKGAMFEKLRNLPNIENRVEIANNVYMALLYADRYNSTGLKDELTQYIITELSKLNLENTTSGFRLKQYNEFAFVLAYDWYFNRNALLEDSRSEFKAQLFPIVIGLLEEYDPEIRPLDLNRAIDHLLTIGLNKGQIRQLIQYVSPLEGNHNSAKFNEYYPSHSTISIDRSNLKHNGGYHTLATLYASLGKLEYSVQCIDSLMKYNTDYFRRRNSTSGHHIVGFLEKYGHTDLVDSLVDYMAQQRKMSKSQFYKELHDRSGYIKFAEIDQYWEKYYYSNIFSSLTLSENNHLAQLWKTSLNKENGSMDKKNFEMAILWKQHASNMYKLAIDRNLKIDKETLYRQLGESVEYYYKVSNAYLDENENTTHHYFYRQSRKINTPRKKMFLYPDHFVNGYFNNSYSGTLFVDYLLENNRLNELYGNSADLELINDWLSNYLEQFPDWNENYRNAILIPDKMLKRLWSRLKIHPDLAKFDSNLILLLMANNAFDNERSKEALDLVSAMDFDRLSITATRWEFLNTRTIYNAMVKLSIHLYRNGRKDSSMKIVNSFNDTEHRIKVYSILAKSLYESAQKEETFFVLDSMISLSKTINNSSLTSHDYRFYVLPLLGKIGGAKMNQMAKELLQDMPDFRQPLGVIRYVSGQANEGNLYNAYTSISTEIPMTGELFCYTLILSDGLLQSKEGINEWSEFDKGFESFHNTIFF